MEKKDSTRIFRVTAYLIFIIAVTFIIIVAKGFLYPIALGILFASLLFPIANLLEKKLRIPRILSNLLTIIIGIVFIVGAFELIYNQFRGIVSDLPALKRTALDNLDALSDFIEETFGLTQIKQKSYLRDIVSNMFDSSNPFFKNAFTATTGTIVRIVLLPVYVFFMLYYRDKFYDFIISIAKPEARQRVEEVLKQVSNVTKHYMGGVFIVVCILCVINSFAFYLVGLNYFIFFGILAAICNFIPYFGTILGFSFALLFAMITETTPNVAIGVVISFFIIQFTENNILTPNIVGGNVKLNPFIIILSLIIGAMVWGIPGMIVIVPTMAVLRIIFEHVEGFQPYAYLLGIEGTEKHSLTLKKIRRLFGVNNKTQK